MSNSNLIDSHCHLNDASFDADRHEVIKRASNAGLSQVIVPAISARRFEQQRRVTQAISGSFAAYGMHPLYFHEHHLPEFDLKAGDLAEKPLTKPQLQKHSASEFVDDFHQLAHWLDTHSPVAVGECGLDNFLTKSPGFADMAVQKNCFIAQLEMARDRQLPVIVHANRAVEQVIQCIRQSGHTLGVVHSFNGSYEQASRLIDLGYYLGFGGAVTHTRATKLRKLLSRLPLDSLLLETDAPFQLGAPSDIQAELFSNLASPQRNEPGLLLSVLESVAEIRAETSEQLSAATAANTKTLFKLPDITLDE